MFDRLKRRFGSVAGPQPTQDCMKNAVQIASLAIHEGINPTIHDVKTPKGRHAYLEVGGQVSSKGVTWGTDFYPELNRDQINSLGGMDVTKQLLSDAINPENDIYGYHRVLERIEREVPGITASVKQYLKK